MDALDAGILRELFRDRVLLWGGGDPRLGTTEIADRLGVDRTTVWTRLRAWRKDGFLVRQEVVPNPSLFGAGIAGGDVRVDDPRRVPRVIEALRLVDGVLAGVEQVGPYVLLLYAHASESALDRCRRLVAALPGVDDVSMCVPFAPPTSGIDLAPTDWRIVKALRRAPDRSLAEVADDAGVSRRTLTRRYGELLAADAIWSFPVLDFTAYRHAVLARLVVGVAGPRGAAGLVNACRRGLPQTLWWEAPLEGAEEGWVDLYVHLDAVAEVQDVHRWLLDQGPVTSVEVHFPKAWFVVPEWFDERIDRAVKDAAGARRRA